MPVVSLIKAYQCTN